MPPKTREEYVPPSLELFGQRVRDSVNLIARGFTTPDADFMAALQIENARRELHILALDGRLFVPESEDGGAAKDALVAYCGEAIRAIEGIRFGFVMSSWTISAKPGQKFDPEPHRGRLHEHPDREELVSVFIADAERDEMWSAMIRRHADRPPTLDPWEQMAEYSGRFVELREYLRGK